MNLNNWLQITDKSLSDKFIARRIQMFPKLFTAYVAMECVFKAFRTVQTQMGAGDWDLTTGAKPLTPDKD